MLRSGAKLTGVSYRSGGEANTAVLSQNVQATFENIAILRTLIGEGKLRGLAAQNKTRTPLLPDLPTMAEAGFADCEANTFFGIVAPAGTPPSHRRQTQCGAQRRLGLRRDAEDDCGARQRGQAQFVRRVCSLYRRPEQKMDRRRQVRAKREVGRSQRQTHHLPTRLASLATLPSRGGMAPPASKALRRT